MPTFGELLTEARRLLGAGKFKDSESIYRRLLAAVPQAADVWHEMGLLQFEAGRAADAVEYVQKAIALEPECSAYQSNLGAVYRKLKRPDEALACFQRALQLAPPAAEAYSNLGLALRDAGQEDAALAAYAKALEMREDYANGHFNRANLLLTIGRLDEAIADYRRAIELQPSDTEAHYRLGVCYYDDNQLDQAMESWQHAMAIRPDYPDARRNRALVWLRQGKYEQGWAEWEHRFGCEEIVTRACSEPRWDGTPLQGRKLLLHTEQGLGDTLQFMRYVEPVRQLADSLTVEVQAPLVPLLAASGYGQIVVPQGTQTACDVQCPLLSVPYTLASHGSQPYWSGPYLAPSAHLAAKWETRVRDTRDMQVGIAWAGNPDHPHDRFRSVRLAELLPLARIDGVRLISLQKGAAANQLADLPADARVVDFGDQFDAANGAFMDTAAVIKNLDLVITVDTSIAHLAGGMGKAVWLLLGRSPDWRWQLDGHETPWYPSTRLFRQRQLHDWGQVFRDVAEQLGALVANSPCKAVESHRDGQLDEAERMDRQTVAAEPGDAHALHSLGVASHQQGQHARAAEYIGRAVRIDPSQIAFHMDLASVYIALERVEEAIASMREVIRREPNHAKAHNDTGVLLANQNRWDEAIDCFRTVLAIEPNYAPAYNNLGNILNQQGHRDEAIDCFRQAVRAQPNLVQAYNNLANTLKAIGQVDEAVRQYREAVRVDPNYAEAYYNLALTLKDQEQVDEAIATYREALRIRPDFFEARFNLGSLLRRQGLVPEALEAFEIAVGQHPDHTEAHYRLGLCYYNDNQLDKAMECWRRAMDLQPEYPEARRNRALVWLRQGKYEQGWAEWEHRFGCPELVTRACSEPRWDGTPLSGRTLLLHTEQGLGDTLQFMRYVEPARKLADSLKIEVQASLVPLLAASGYGPLLVPQKTPTACDVQCPLLSVPYTLASRGSEPYWNGPYLAPSADLVASWEPRVRTTRDLQVGIAWAGNPGHTYDRFRSVRLAEFLPLARMTGVRLISLQKGAEATQLADLPADARVVDFGDSFDSANGAFMDTAAVIKNLDLVIAVDTSIAHLAGGMGMPVWVLLQFSPDWRWRLDGHETPWYPSMRLFRQQRPHDWGQVFRDVAEQLGALVANRPS